MQHLALAVGHFGGYIPMKPYHGKCLKAGLYEVGFFIPPKKIKDPTTGPQAQGLMRIGGRVPLSGRYK